MSSNSALISSTSDSSKSDSNTTPSTSLTPVMFLAHGGGPCFYMKRYPGSPFTFMDSESEAADWLRGLAKSLNLSGETKPKALIVISAHWEERDSIHVTGREQNPKLLYDYYGFPKETYEIQYPAPGNPKIAAEIVAKLQSAGFKAELDTNRNFDHGVFVPLGLVYPAPDDLVPIIQVSLLSSLSPSQHIAMGKQLQEFRKQNIFIIGSGFLTHNLSGSGKGAEEFVGSVNKIVTKEGGLTSAQKEEALVNWESLPYARSQHPREEHLIPLHVCLGAAGGSDAEIINNMWNSSGRMGKSTLTSYLWRN